MSAERQPCSCVRHLPLAVHVWAVLVPRSGYEWQGSSPAGQNLSSCELESQSTRHMMHGRNSKANLTPERRTFASFRSFLERTDLVCRLASLPVQTPQGAPPSRGLQSLTAIGTKLYLFGGTLCCFL